MGTASTPNRFCAGLVILSAVTLVACDANRRGALNGTPGAAGGTSGAAGSGGTTSAGGSGGLGSSPNPVPRVLAISAREAARRLAVVIWDAQPDAALLAEADSGTIQTSEDVRTLALRMLKDPRARKGVGAFYRWWLKLDGIAAVTKDATLFPQFTADLRADMAKESELLGVHVTLDLDGVMDMLFTLPFSFLTERTAAVYGIAGITGAEHRKVAVDPTQRAGLLTNPGILSLNAMPLRTSISLRGTFVSERVLCRPIPGPPAGIPGPPEPQAAGVTFRAYLAMQVSSPGCSTCHALMDNFGYAFEGLDTIGRVQTMDNGGQINTSGRIVGSRGEQLEFNGPRELGQRMLGVEDTAVCFTRHWLSFALGSVDPVNPTPDFELVARTLSRSGWAQHPRGDRGGGSV